MRLQGSEEGDETAPQWKWTGLETRQEGGKGLLLQDDTGSQSGTWRDRTQAEQWLRRAGPWEDGCGRSHRTERLGACLGQGPGSARERR